MGSNIWLAAHTPRPEAEFRMFLLPYAGGNSAIYRQWESSVPSFIEVCPIQLPGRSSRYSEAPYRRIEELVRWMLKGLSEEIKSSYVLFGHSMGSLIAYEWARQTKINKYNSPTMLFVSGSLPPNVQKTNAYHKLPDTEFIQMLKSYQGTPDDVFTNRELLSIILPLIRSDFEMVETYWRMDDKKLDCPITMFGGDEDELVSPAEMEGWSSYTLSTLERIDMSGGHFFLHERYQEIISIIADRMQKYKYLTSLKTSTRREEII